MYTKEDILARLLAGTSSDTIAAEMADALNAAQEAKKEIDERKAKEAAIQEAKRASMRQVQAALADYYANFVDGSADLVESLRNMSDEEVDFAIKGMDTTGNICFKLGQSLKVPEEKRTVGRAVSGSENPFADFFKNMGWM